MDKDKINLIHPLYLTEVTLKKNYELLTIPEEKNNKIIYSNNNLSKDKKNYNIDIGNVNFNEEKLLKIVYNIVNWKSLHEFLEKNIRDYVKVTIDRLFNYSWKTFYDNYVF